MNTEFQNLVQGLDKHFKNLGIDFFIIGAKARDIISEQVGLSQSVRMTRDVDFGVLVDSWDTLEKLRNSFSTDSDIRLSSEENQVRY